MKRLLAFLLSALILFLAGCTEKKGKPVPRQPVEQQKQERTDGEADGDDVEDGDNDTLEEKD